TILLDRLKLFTHIDTFFVYSTWQERFIRQRWGIPSERVVFTPFMVDDSFFAPGTVNASKWPRWLADLRRPVICAVGLERRDYPTLIDAVRGLDVRVVIAAASPWSKQSDTTEGRALPENVTVRKFSQFELRQVYDASAFLVMPLEPVEFQAGVTAILEAMAMGKAVVCTRTDGQTDVLREGETGLYVPPKDPSALRAAIQKLLTDPEQAARMGERGRRVIEDQMNLARYCQRLGDHVARAKAASP
ncbi:MAG TPA: glycosyltransferase family 4 protein, partial [Polyangiaceae bacterium]|nr:glycosyltransferase family 4 protein [Polyangiaceae bacterium]